MRDEERGKRLLAVFLLGLVLFNFPLLAVVDSGDRLFGLPAVVIYLFGAWAGLIACLALVVEARKPDRGAAERRSPD